MSNYSNSLSKIQIDIYKLTVAMNSSDVPDIILSSCIDIEILENDFRLILKNPFLR